MDKRKIAKVKKDMKRYTNIEEKKNRMKQERITAWSRYRRPVIIMLMAAVLAFGLCGCTLFEEEQESGNILEVSDDLVMHFIDVGQADCTLLISKGEAMLIDAGNRDDNTMVMGYLRQLGVDKLKYMILTHTDEDHIGSCEAILESIPVERVYVQQKYMTKTGEYVMKELDKLGIKPVEPKVGDEISLGESQIVFIGPTRSYDTNDGNSICVRVTHGSIDTIFTGDAEKRQENDMIDSGETLEAELLQAGHHGSSKANGWNFLEAMDLKYAVISCGEDNPYGHPHKETMKRLGEKNVEVYRTDKQGTIVATSDGSSLKFDTVSKQEMADFQNEYESEPYIANMNSGTFHIPSCESLPKMENRVYYMTKKAAAGAGYQPCGVCNP